jgi:hypothetical protein
MLVRHEPMVRLLFLSAADVTRNSLPDHRVSPSPAERNRFLYFIVRSGKTVSELLNETIRGPKPEGRDARPETEHSLPKLSDPKKSSFYRADSAMVPLTCQRRSRQARDNFANLEVAPDSYCLGAK